MKKHLLVVLTLLILSEIAAQNCNGPNLIPEEGSTFGTSLLITQRPSPYVVGHALENETGVPPDDGEYGFSRDTDNWGIFADFFWHQVRAQGATVFSNDYFLVVNAAYGAQAFLRYDIDLCPSTEYRISLDAINMFRQGTTSATNDAGFNVAIVHPRLAVYVNGQELSDLGEIPQNEQWQTYEATFVTPATAENLSLEIWNTNPGFISPTDPGNKDFGRDFAVDNIVVTECGFVPQTLSERICEGEFLNLYGQIYDQSGQYSDAGVFNGCQYSYTLDLEVSERDEVRVNIQFCGSGVYEGQTYTQSTNLPAQNFTNAAGCDSIVVVQIEVLPTYNTPATASICRGEIVEGIAIFQDTTFTVQATTMGGCDSIITYDVNIREPISRDIISEICPDESYILGTQTLTEAGTYSELFQAQNGCDSLVNLDLRVLPAINVPLNEQICAGESYFFNGQARTTTGTYTSFATTSSGCDSITTLNLTVNENTSGFRFVNLCAGESFQGVDYTENATLAETLTNATGCDSLLTIEIVVAPLYDRTENVSICAGESVENIAVFQDTTIVVQASSIANCDSITRYQVRVNQPETNNFPWQICAGETYTLGSQTLSSAGIYSETFTNVAGCDSVVTVQLAVLDNISVPLTETICVGESFLFGGVERTESGVYNTTNTTATGCDSTTILTLTVAESSSQTLQISLCEGELYQGVVYTQNETLTETLTNVAGCDSLLTTEISVTPLYDETENVSVCAGESVEGIAVFQDTMIVVQVTSLAGCDSITTFEVQVNSVESTDFAWQICEGETYTLGNQNLTTDGTYSEVFQTVAGCDSVVTVNLTVLTTISNSVFETICAGESYEFDGQMLSEAGIYEMSETTTDGCVSITALTLDVAEPTSETIEVALCEGELYQGVVYTQNETLTETLTNVAGCDSLLTTEISVTPLYDETENVSVCAGESVEGIAVFQDTMIVVQAISLAGCDSVMTFEVQVNQPETNSFAWQICEGETYTLGNQNLTTDGTYSEVFQTVAGCDSVVTVNLTVLTTISNSVFETICAGESYEFDGQMLSEAGVYEMSETITNGCVSITTLTLDVAEPTSETIEVTLCEGELYQGVVYTQNETLTETLTNVAGCDSLLTTEISITPLYNETENVSVCAGESVEGIAVFQDTMIVVQATSVVGCDSMTTFEVQVNQLEANSFAWQICEGETYTLGTQALAENGTYSELFQTTAGCDSLVTVALSVLNSITVPIAATICEGESYDFNGQMLTEAGVYNTTETTATGCDSTTTLRLEIALATGSSSQVQLCEGEMYQGLTYTQSDVLVETLTNAAGCDSTLTTEIIVAPVYNQTESLNLCAGDSFEGIIIQNDTSIIRTLQSVAGCDSTRVFNIQVEDLDSFRILGDAALCPDATGTLDAGEFSSYIWSTGETSRSINIDSTGAYSVTVTSAAGCTTSDAINVTVSELQAQIIASDPSCNTYSDGQIIIQASEGVPPYTYRLNGEDAQSDFRFQDLTAGDYEIQIEDSEGCSLSLLYPLLEPSEFSIDLGKDTTLRAGDSLQLNVLSNQTVNTYIWESTASLSCANCPNPVLTSSVAANVQLSAINANGCIATASVNIGIEGYEIYEPTAFSPNEDGINEEFELGFGENVNMIRRFVIFDRWGNQLYGVEMLEPNAPELSWNGKFREKLMDRGVYIWAAEVEFADGIVRPFTGDVLLMR